MRRLGLALSLAFVACADPSPIGATASPIVNGAPTSEFPAVVALGARPGTCATRIDVSCTATLIGPRTLLTAAHCVVTSGPLSAFLGADVSGAGEMRHIVSARVHPDYDENGYVNDLAVLTLDRPVTLAPISLSPTAPDTVGEVVTIVGFGTIDGTTGTGFRRSGTSRVRAVAEGTFEIEPAPSMSCGGDSGGPVLRGAELVGVTSSGDTKCKVFGRNIAVAAYASFIRDALAASEAWVSDRPPFVAATMCTATCEDDAACPDGFQCETGDDGIGRCVNAPQPLARYEGSCSDDRECGGGVCTRVVGASTCLCAQPCVAEAQPTFRATGGGCMLGASRCTTPWFSLGLLAIIALRLCGKKRQSLGQTSLSRF